MTDLTTPNNQYAINPDLVNAPARASDEVSDNSYRPTSFSELFMAACDELPVSEQAQIEDEVSKLIGELEAWGENDDLTAAEWEQVDEHYASQTLTGNPDVDLAILGSQLSQPPEFVEVDIDPEGDTYITRAQEGEFFLAADGRFGYRVVLPNLVAPVEVTLLEPDKNVFAPVIDQIVHFGTTLMNQKWFFVVRGPSIGGVSDTLDFTFDPTTGTAEDIRVYDGTPVPQNTVLFGALPAEIEYVDEVGEDGELVSYVKNVTKIFTAGFPQSFVEMLEKFVVLATVHGHRMPQAVIRVEAPHDLTKAPTFGGEPIVEAESDTDDLSSVDFSGETD